MSNSVALKTLVDNWFDRCTAARRPSDLANARANIRAFVQLMKSEAVFLGEPDRLDKETLRAAHRRLERKGFLTTFTLGLSGRMNLSYATKRGSWFGKAPKVVHFYASYNDIYLNAYGSDLSNSKERSERNEH